MHNTALAEFRLAQYRVIMVAGPEGLVLPPYKGSTLRGGFGGVFRHITCATGQKECLNCLLKDNCPYAYIFETAPPPGATSLRNYDSVPRPFVLEPPLDDKTHYRPGEELTFNLILIGHAIEYLPYFIVVFRELGQTGLGKGRRQCELAEVRAINPLNGKEEKIYEGVTGTVKNIDLSVTGQQVLERTAGIPKINRLTIDFVTMTRLKFHGEFVAHIEFNVLIRALLRRLSSLVYFHHGRELHLDFVGLIERAKQVRRVEDRTSWVNLERYSSRQHSRISLGGVVGRVAYEDPGIAEFLPILALGELVHVGKSIVFGMGKYRMEE